MHELTQKIDQMQILNDVIHAEICVHMLWRHGQVHQISLSLSSAKSRRDNSLEFCLLL